MTAPSRWLGHTGSARAFAVALAVGTACAGTIETEPGAGRDTTPVPAAEAPDRRGRGGRLVVGLAADPTGLTPSGDGWDDAARLVAGALFDPLAAPDESGAPQPYLAESITDDGGGTSWSITVRAGVRFHDGTPLDADAVAANLEARRDDPATASSLAPISTVDAVDERTVRLTTSVPWVAFPHALTGPAGLIVAPQQLADPEGARRPVGTGPFVLREWQEGSHLLAGRNDAYWRPDLPLLDEIEFRIVPDAADRISALEAGELQVTRTRSPEDLVRLGDLAETGDYELVEAATEDRETVVVMDTAAAPLDDPSIRLALAQATDPAEMAGLGGAGILEVATGPYPSESPWFTPTAYPGHDPEAASEAIRAYESIVGPVEVRLGAGDGDDLVAQLLAEQWTAAGVDVEIAGYDATEAAFGDLHAVVDHRFDSADPDGEYVWWHSAGAGPPGPRADSPYSDPALDDALAVGRSAGEADARLDAYRTVQRRLAEGLPYLWLLHDRTAVAATADVGGLADPTLPDGSPALPLVAGVPWLAGVWLASR